MSGTQLPPPGEYAAAEIFQGSQRELGLGRTAILESPRPLEFDRNGFPVAQRRPQRSREFIARVDRLLSP